jgi:hypothetical protein
MDARTRAHTHGIHGRGRCVQGRRRGEHACRYTRTHTHTLSLSLSNTHTHTQGVSLYIDEANVPGDAEEASMQIHKYVLHPTSAQMAVGYDGVHVKWDVSRPKIAVTGTVCSMCFQVQRSQFLALVTVADEMSKHASRAPPRPGRPQVKVSEDARAWWRYARDLVLDDVRDRSRRRSAGYLTERRKVRLRYTELFVQQRTGSMGKREAAELDRLEEEYSFHDLVFFRCCALKRLRDEKKKVLERKQTSWYSRFKGARLRRGEDEYEEGGEEGTTPLMTLTREERESLLSVMEVPRLEAGETTPNLWQSLSPEQRMYSVALVFDEVALSLVDPGQKLDTCATLVCATLQMEGKAAETSIDGRVQSLTVMEMLSGRTLCGRTAPGALGGGEVAQGQLGGGGGRGAVADGGGAAQVCCVPSAGQGVHTNGGGRYHVRPRHPSCHS